MAWRSGSALAALRGALHGRNAALAAKRVVAAPAPLARPASTAAAWPSAGRLLRLSAQSSAATSALGGAAASRAPAPWAARAANALALSPARIAARRAMSENAKRHHDKLPNKGLRQVDDKHKRRTPPREMAKRTPMNERPMFISRVISVDAVRKTTKGGRVNRFRALVVCGNGNGAAGFAIGKAETVRKAVQKAYMGSLKRWVAIELSPDKGLYHDVEGKFNNTKVLLRSCKPFKGLTAGNVVRGILECFGIENATTKVIGRRTESSVVYSTFHALSLLRTPEEISRTRGRKIVRRSRWEL